MKTQNILLMLTLGVFLSGCLSTLGPEIGMTEKQWLHRTLIADVAYMKDNVLSFPDAIHLSILCGSRLTFDVGQE